MKESYIKCLKMLRKYRKQLGYVLEIKKGKLYFNWIKEKTEKIKNENNEIYIYKNVKNMLKNYAVDQYNYERLEPKLKYLVNTNYLWSNKSYIFKDTDIPKEDAMLILKKVILTRSHVVWIDFGFNIGKEFGGMHPAIIIKNFDSELFVLPISSKKPKEFRMIEKEFFDKKITYDECKKKKGEITEIVQIDSIYGFKSMTRWVNITRIRKVSILRINFCGTVGKVSGKYMKEISEKISMEF